MFLFERILRAVRSWFKPEPVTNFTLDVDTFHTLQVIAAREQRAPEDVINAILDDAFRSHQAQKMNWLRWQMLTPREKEIAALLCLNYTNHQIAAKLHISNETVKTHVEHILSKYEITDRNMLRLLMGGWDFRSWDQ